MPGWETYMKMISCNNETSAIISETKSCCSQGNQFNFSLQPISEWFDYFENPKNARQNGISFYKSDRMMKMFAIQIHSNIIIGRRDGFSLILMRSKTLLVASFIENNRNFKKSKKKN